MVISVWLMQMMMKMTKNGNVMVILHVVDKKLYCMNPIVYQARLMMDQSLDYLISCIVCRLNMDGVRKHRLCKNNNINNRRQ